MRKPPANAPLPEKRLSVAPTTNKATPESEAAMVTPWPKPNRNGMSGRLAPMQKAMKEEIAHPIPEAVKGRYLEAEKEERKKKSGGAGGGE